MGEGSNREVRPGEMRVEHFAPGDVNHPLLERVGVAPLYVPPWFREKLREASFPLENVNAVLAMGWENAKRFYALGGKTAKDARAFMLAVRDEAKSHPADEVKKLNAPKGRKTRRRKGK